MHATRVIAISTLALLLIIGCFIIILGLGLFINTAWFDESPTTDSVSSRLVDADIVPTDQCFRSCWQSLAINTTTEETLIEFLMENRDTIRDIKKLDVGGQISYQGVYKEEGTFITFRVDKDYLQKIELAGNLDYTLENTLDAFGRTPHTLLFYKKQVDGSYDSNLTLFYPEYGYIFRFDGLNVTRKDSSHITICENTNNRVSIFYVFPSDTSLAQFTGNIYGPASPVNQKVLDYLKPWTGYGCQEIEVLSNDYSGHYSGNT